MLNTENQRDSSFVYERAWKNHELSIGDDNHIENNITSS
jgi:hypothetical protein